MNQRYYVPITNRFLTPDSIVPDPADPQSWNRYSYTRNNPINRTDPTGHIDCSLTGEDCDGNKFIQGSFNLTAQQTLSSFCVLNACEGDGIGMIDVQIQGEEIMLPYHINPNYSEPDSLFPWEAPADVLYAEHGNLHPSHSYYDNFPDWRDWLKTTWRPEAMGILQTMVNRAESSKWSVNTPTEAALSDPGTQYSAPYRDYSLAWIETYAVSFEVIMMGERVNQPYTYYSHQDLSEVRGYDPNDRNALCCNERTGFGPTPGWKDHYVFPLPISNRPLQ